jgi:hypothetical protein
MLDLMSGRLFSFEIPVVTPSDLPALVLVPVPAVWFLGARLFCWTICKGAPRLVLDPTLRYLFNSAPSSITPSLTKTF